MLPPGQKGGGWGGGGGGGEKIGLGARFQKIRGALLSGGLNSQRGRCELNS